MLKSLYSLGESPEFPFTRRVRFDAWLHDTIGLSPERFLPYRALWHLPGLRSPNPCSRWVRKSEIGKRIRGKIVPPPVEKSTCEGKPAKQLSERVCAVIVTYNCGNKVFPTARSVMPQVDRVLFIDNGSRDSTGKILERIRDESPRSVEIVTLEENRGIAYALNLGSVAQSNWDTRGSLRWTTTARRTVAWWRT